MGVQIHCGIRPWWIPYGRSLHPRACETAERKGKEKKVPQNLLGGDDRLLGGQYDKRGWKSRPGPRIGRLFYVDRNRCLLGYRLGLSDFAKRVEREAQWNGFCKAVHLRPFEDALRFHSQVGNGTDIAIKSLTRATWTIIGGYLKKWEVYWSVAGANALLGPSM